MLSRSPHATGGHVATLFMRPRLPERYTALAELGSGGMASVYRATDANLGRQVAIKVMGSAIAEDPRLRALFAHEARAAATVSHHPNVVVVYTSGPDLPSAVAPTVEIGAEGEAHDPYIVMELVDGGSLAATVARGGERKLHAGVGAICQAARGVGHGHLCGVVHRDIKPHNLLRSTSGQVKVTDFGIAKLLDDAPSTLTAGGLATWAYCAPEILRSGGSAASARSDIYALAVTGYEVLCGKRPYNADTHIALLRQQIAGPPDLSELPPDTPREVLLVFSRALSYDPANRQPTADEFADQLEQAAGREVTPLAQHSRPSRAPDPSRSERAQLVAASLRAAGLMIAVVVLTITVIFLLRAWS